MIDKENLAIKNNLYEKTYAAGKRNAQNFVCSCIFIAICIAYFFIINWTTNNEGGDFGGALAVSIRLVGCTYVLIGAGVVFLINGTASAFIASKMIKMSQREKIGKGVYIVSAIIKILAALALLYAAGMIILYGFFFPLKGAGLLFVGDLLFALVLAGAGIYQIVLMVQEGKSSKELFSI